MGDIFALLFLNPITNVLVFFYHVLLYIHIPFALGFSIIVMTAFIRVLLYPFVSAQIKSTAKMQSVTPHIASIKEKHKKDKKRQQEEMMKLYKEFGINPASGCLPALIQLPIIWSLYHVLTTVVASTSPAAIQKINDVLYFPFLHINHIWNNEFFGLVLSDSPSKLFPTHPWVILVPLLTGGLQFFYSRMMMPENPPAKKGDDFQSAFQAQSMFIFPIMIGFFSFTFPLGLSLYWNTFTLFGILQQYYLVGPGGLKPLLAKIKK